MSFPKNVSLELEKVNHNGMILFGTRIFNKDVEVTAFSSSLESSLLRAVKHFRTRFTAYHQAIIERHQSTLLED